MTSEEQGYGGWVRPPAYHSAPPGEWVPPPPANPSAPPPYSDPQNLYSGGHLPQGAAVPYAQPPLPGVGFYPPPPYPGEQHSGYLPGYPPTSQLPMPHGGPRLYPDVYLLPQPQAVSIGFSGASGPTPSGPAPVVPMCPAPAPPGMAPAPPGIAPAPQRMAPAPPGIAPAPPGMAPAPPGIAPAFLGMAPGAHMPPTPPGSNENLALANLKEGEAPAGCVVSWRGGEGLQLFFLQAEGHIVSPAKKPLVMSVYKKIRSGEVANGRMIGLVEVHGCWRLKLCGPNSFAIRAASDTYVFRDDSTCPAARVVVVQLPPEVSSTMRVDLAALLGELVDLKELGGGTVDKMTTGVSTVYTGLTKKASTAVKDTVPGAHKSTKWLRKGTGNLVRMGGNLVSKGMHFVADQIPAGDQQHQEESSAHIELMEALNRYRRHLEEGTITYV